MDLLDSGPVALAAAVRGGAVGSEELVRAVLDRVARLDPALGAFVSVRADGAVRDARRKDADRARGRPLPPFHGVPIGIKDLNLVRFSRTGFGTRALPALWSPIDDRTVARLRAAGFVIVGKLATSELGAVPITEPRGRPPARNPWDPARTPGGSSGGSAAAVASGMLPVAHGSDGGGSIRIPASLCGLVGLKPSRGRLANAFGADDPGLIYTCGALVRSVGDAAAMLDVMAGGAKGGLPLPDRSFAALAEAGPGRRLRVRMTVDVPLVETDPAVRAAVVGVAEALAAMGHDVEEVPPPAADIDEFLPIWQALIASIRWMPASRLEPTTRWLAEAGRRLPAGAARARQHELTERWRPWAEGADVLLTPTVAIPPPPVGAYAGWDAEAHFKAAAALGIFTAPFNVTGQPAITVPIGLHPTLGTPMGAQLAGAIGAEGTLLALAREIERALPWAHLRPQVHGAPASETAAAS